MPQQGQTGEEPSEEGFSKSLWREAGVGANPSSTSYQRHGIGAITDSSGTGLTINTCLKMHEVMYASASVVLRDEAWESHLQGCVDCVQSV